MKRKKFAELLKASGFYKISSAYGCRGVNCRAYECPTRGGKLIVLSAGKGRYAAFDGDGTSRAVAGDDGWSTQAQVVALLFAHDVNLAVKLYSVEGLLPDFDEGPSSIIPELLGMSPGDDGPAPTLAEAVAKLGERRARAYAAADAERPFATDAALERIGTMPVRWEREEAGEHLHVAAVFAISGPQSCDSARVILRPEAASDQVSAWWCSGADCVAEVADGRLRYMLLARFARVLVVRLVTPGAAGR